MTGHTSGEGRHRAEPGRHVGEAERAPTPGELLEPLADEGWTLLRDVPWPGRRHATIDHLVVGFGHAFVIDTKGWSGEIDVQGGQLCQNGRSRHQYVVAVADAARAVAAAIPGVPAGAVHPVLCVLSDQWLAEEFGEVMVCSTPYLAALVRTQPAAPEPLSDELGRELLTRLRVGVTAAAAPRRRWLGRRHDEIPAAVGRPRRTRAAAGVAAVLAVTGVVLLQPEWATSVADRIAGVVTEVVSHDGRPAPDDQQRQDGEQEAQGR